MKLNGSILVAVAMMIGSIGALGCKSSDASSQPDEASKVEQPAADTATTETPAAKDESVNVLAKASVSVGERDERPRFVPMAPPPPRFEHRGRAPSARHFWVNGYHKYVNGRYIWVGGHWDTQRGDMIYLQPHYDRVDGHYRYIPGHFVRR